MVIETVNLYRSFLEIESFQKWFELNRATQRVTVSCKLEPLGDDSIE